MWVHRYPEGTRGANAPRQLSGRGVAYWSDGRNDHRILYVTPGYRLIALDAKTGQPVKTFGKDGVVDLKVGVTVGDGKQIDLETRRNRPPLDAYRRQGRRPRRLCDEGRDDRPDAQQHERSGARVRRAHRTADLDVQHHSPAGRIRVATPGWTTRGRPTATPACGRRSPSTKSWVSFTCPSNRQRSDYYGGKRPGSNLFGESLVCVDLATGKRKWHFQFVHHPIWDHDMSSAPLMADVTVNGRARKVVAVPSKQAWLYVFDRVTGEPIWPIEEKPVPKGDVPGEWYSPTQPHPPAALMYGRNAVTFPDDLVDFTPELRAQAEKQIARYRYNNGVVYTPPMVGNTNGLLGSITMGAANGGTNWPGGGYDPETHTVYRDGGNGNDRV